MKKLLVCAFALTSISAFAGISFDVKCSAPKAKHASIRTFEITNFSGILAEDSYQDGADLLDRDARQYDTATVENGVISLSLNNGCDNAYDFTLSKAEFKNLLKNKTKKITVKLDYAYIPEDENEANANGYAEGKLTATCVKK